MGRGSRTVALAATVALIYAAVFVSSAGAFVTTDQADYAPGSTVTISGDNSDGAGYLPGESVHVDVSGPNGYASACDATAEGSGAWSCQVILNDDESAVGAYSYTAVGQQSGVTESSTFTDESVVYISAGGSRQYGRTQTVTVRATLLSASKYYTFVVRDANTADANYPPLNTVQTSSCQLGVTGTTGLTDSFIPTITNRLSSGDITPAGGQYQYRLYAFSNSACTTRTSGDVISTFAVGQVYAFTTSAARDACTAEPTTGTPCAGAQTSFPAGTTVYLAVLGFRFNQADINATFNKAAGSPCLVTAPPTPTDRPDSNVNGVIGSTSVQTLQYPPLAFNAGSPCGATTNTEAGPWTLTLDKATTLFRVTLPAFTVVATGTIELKKHWVGTAGSTTLQIGTTAGNDDVDSQLVSGADGTTVQDTVTVGTYYISEDPSPPVGYTMSSSCFNDADNNGSLDVTETAFPPAVDGSVSVAAGDHIICTITNTEAITALSPAHLWVGLKNSDDQGTRFDVKIELYQNTVLVASGLERCVNGVTRNPSFATEAIVDWNAFSAVAVSSGDILWFKVSTRIGTNADNSKCVPGPGGSHNNATGLRLYYDSTTRPSAFDMTLGGPSANEYLHSDGNACVNAPSTGVNTRYFNSTAPTAASPKCKDSTGINFSGGNLFKEIGTWTMTLP